MPNLPQAYVNQVPHYEADSSVLHPSYAKPLMKMVLNLAKVKGKMNPPKPKKRRKLY